MGGWLATRGGGHFATGPTHIDDMCVSLRVVSPAGVTETRKLPGSGAGPAEHRCVGRSHAIRCASPPRQPQIKQLDPLCCVPVPIRHYVGSEGAYGIITEAWLRVRRRPNYRASATVVFPVASDGTVAERAATSFLRGARAGRRVVQSTHSSGLLPPAKKYQNFAPIEYTNLLSCMC